MQQSERRSALARFGVKTSSSPRSCGTTIIDLNVLLRRCAQACSDSSIAHLSEVLDGARIRPAVIQVEAHPYLPQWELLEVCQRQRVVFLAFAALGHGVKPRVLDDPIVADIARRTGNTPAQVLLAWAVQRGTALLTTAKTPSRIRENFDASPIPDDAIAQLNGISTRYRFNPVVDTGLPGFIPHRD